MKLCKPVLVLLVAVALFSGILDKRPADAGEITYIKLNPTTADADSGISTDNIYTHTLDFGDRAPATVNGVAFTQVNAGNVDGILDFSYLVDSGQRQSHGGNAGTGVDPSQSIHELYYDMLYNGQCAPGGTATITLSGLVPGVEYQTRIYNRQWGPSPDRTATWNFDTDGLPGAENSVPLSADDSSTTPPSDGTYAADTAYMLTYTYTATDEPLTISIVQDNLNNAWHLYGLTNQELPAGEMIWNGAGPGTWSSANWDWPLGTPATGSPDLHTNTTIQTDTVTVAADAAARILTVDSGGIAVNAGQSLAVMYKATFASGTALTLGEGASFSAAGGALDGVTTAGNATLAITSGKATVASLTAAAGTIAKQGAGELSLGNSGVTAAPSTIFKVEEGVLRARGAAPLGQASMIELAGGTLKLEGGGVVPTAGPAGAIAHYGFDSVVADVTPNSGSAGALLAGTLTGNAALTSGGGGLVGEALQCDGGHVDVPYDAVLGLNEFTVSAWVNLDNEATASGILGTRINGDTTFDVKVRENDIHGDVGSGTGWINTDIDIRATDTGTNGQGGDISVGDWHLVTYVVDETDKQFELYLDGDLKRTIAYTGTPLFMKEGQSLWIGDDYVSTPEPMDGRIDEVRLYGRALDATEVDSLWGNGFGPNDGTAGLDMSLTGVLVTDDSTLSAIHGAAGGGPAPFATLTLQNGVITTDGSAAGVSFAGTTIAPSATSVGLDPRSPTAYGTITNTSTQPVVTISKAGPSTWTLDAPVAGTTSNIKWRAAGGTMVAQGSGVLSGRPISLDGGSLVLASDVNDAAIACDSALTVVQDGTVTAGSGGNGTTGATVTLGGASKGVVIEADTTLTLAATDDYSLNVAGNVTGAGRLLASQGDVTLSAGGTFGSLVVTEASLNTATSVTVDRVELLGTGRITTDSSGITVNNGGTMTLPTNTFTAIGSSFNADGVFGIGEVPNLTLEGGTVTVGPAQGALNYYLITGDADSGIDSSKTYTHAIDFGTAGTATVNGVAFANGFAGNGSEDIPNAHPGNLSTPVTGEVAKIFQDMDYNNRSGQIILTGLTAGQAYDLRLYHRSWEENHNRSQRFDVDFDNDGTIDGNVTLNEDAADAVPPGMTNWNDAYAMSLLYVAGPSGQIRIVANQVGAGSYHLYGLTNETATSSLVVGDLAGTGALDSNTVEVQGNLAPGNGLGIGLLTIDGSLKMGDGSTYQWQLAAGLGLGDIAHVNSGDLDVVGGNWTLDVSSVGDDDPDPSAKYTLFTFDAPENLTGLTPVELTTDFNGDGTVDDGDLNLLLSVFSTSDGDATWNAVFDVAASGAIDEDDLNVLLEQFGMGDGDWGGTVFGNETAPGRITTAAGTNWDVTQALVGYDEVEPGVFAVYVTGLAPAPPMTVPEPSSLALLLLASLGLAPSARRRRK